MKLYAKTVLVEILNKLGFDPNTIYFGTPNFELKEERQNFNYEEIQLFLNVLEAEYENNFKHAVLGGQAVLQGITGISSFKVRATLIGTDELLIDEIENLIIRNSNYFFSVGGFQESRLSVLNVAYRLEDEQITPDVFVVNMELLLRLPVFSKEPLKVIEGGKLKINHEIEFFN